MHCFCLPDRWTRDIQSPPSCDVTCERFIAMFTIDVNLQIRLRFCSKITLIAFERPFVAVNISFVSFQILFRFEPKSTQVTRERLHIRMCLQMTRFIRNKVVTKMTLESVVWIHSMHEKRLFFQITPRRDRLMLANYNINCYTSHLRFMSCFHEF